MYFPAMIFFSLTSAGLKKATSEVKAKAIKSPEYSPSNPKGTKSYRALGIKNEDAFYKEKMKDPKFAKAVYKTKGNKNLPASIDNRMRQLNANNRLDKINKNPKTKKMYEKGITFGTKALKAITVGKIALGVGAAGVAAQQYLKSKMNKKPEQKPILLPRISFFFFVRSAAAPSPGGNSFLFLSINFFAPIPKANIPNAAFCTLPGLTFSS